MRDTTGRAIQVLRRVAGQKIDMKMWTVVLTTDWHECEMQREWDFLVTVQSKCEYPRERYEYSKIPGEMHPRDRAAFAEYIRSYDM